MSTCIRLMAFGGVGFDFVCVAARVGGFVKNQLDGKYESRYLALTISLEHFDELGLGGIN
ncbi:hypothetical protein WDW37_21285 [Bdellovibrionota bacterium FG-1]